MGALNGNRVEDLRDRLAERDKLIGELYRGIKDIQDMAINGITSHRDIISGICNKLITQINCQTE